MRRLNKSVVVGGVVYPAGAAGADVEAAITNPEHWDGGEPTAASHVVQVGLSPEVLEKVNELASQLERSAEQIDALLGAVAPLIDADPDDLYDAVFEAEDGLAQLADKVVGLTAQTSEDDNGTGEETTAPVDYSALSKEDLEAEVIKRNADGRDSEIVVGGRGNKPDLVAALTADDE